jgi:hypothetical protein
MATYLELNTIAADAAFLQRIKAACAVATEVIRTEAATAANAQERKAWARSVLSSPDETAAQMVWAVLAQNVGFTAAQITGATDATLQTAVNNAVNLLATRG